VVPSRWENFPNTCIEAMCSGLPVIATMQGGMADMLYDGQTGWLAERAERECLAEALRRALKTPPAQLAEMGRKASSDIRKMCDNEETVERHLRFRNQVAHQGARRSVRLPVNLPWSRRPLCDESARRRAKNNSEKGLVIVVNGMNNAQMLSWCLQSIERQTRPPSKVVLMLRHIQDNHVRQSVQKARSLGWQVCEVSSSEAAAAKNAGIEVVFANGADPLAFIFLDAMDSLYPGFVETCERVFGYCTEVGLVSSWMQNADGDQRFFAYPCPAFSYQLLNNETIPATAIRTEALRETGLFRDDLNSGFEQWDLVNAVMALGWTAVTVPELLCERFVLSSRTIFGQESMYRELLARMPEVVARDAQELIHLLRSLIQSHRQISSAPYKILRPRDIFMLTPSQLRSLFRKHLRNPGPAIRFLLWHANKGIGNIGARLTRTNSIKKNAHKP
jgi:GT2 family glycosyltransferase